MGSVSWESLLWISVRSLAVYLFIFAALRIFGKKELSQLNTLDIILILLISNAVQNAMVGPDTSLVGGLTAAAVLFLINFIFRKIRKKPGVIGEFLSDHPQVLVHDGKPDFKMLSRLDISNDEIGEAMREHGVEHFSEVKLAMLEPDGNISVITGSDSLRQTKHKRRHPRKNLQQ